MANRGFAPSSWKDRVDIDIREILADLEPASHHVIRGRLHGTDLYDIQQYFGTNDDQVVLRNLREMQKRGLVEELSHGEFTRT
jgi:predicted MarR family transcription regulator